MNSYSSYRGYPIYWVTLSWLVCYAPGISGVWNSEKALCDYIDFVIATKEYRA